MDDLGAEEEYSIGPPPEEIAEDFERLAVEYLRSELPAETGAYSDDDLRERIRSAIPRCVAYDLTADDEILHFLEASYLLGEDFDSGPDGEWVAEVLGDPKMTAGERAAMLAAIAGLLAEEQRS